MADLQSPMIMPGEKTVTQLRQITVNTDEQVEGVNRLLSDGWRLISIGYHTSATVYVLGRIDEKPKHRPGFLSGE
jgi:hypothetical protein